MPGTPSSLAAGAGRTRDALEAAIEERAAAVDTGIVHGYGLQWLQPLATIAWSDGTRVLYGPVTPAQVGLLLDEAAGLVGAAAELAIGVLSGSRPGIPRIGEHPYLACEDERRLLQRIGYSNPDEIDHYVATGGYHALSRMLDRHHGPAAVRQLQQDAQLLGKGGAFFPAGVKWNFLAGAADSERYLVCNADEGDPGAWVNRVLLEGDPHVVIEGMLIAAHATTAIHGFIYIRSEYPAGDRAHAPRDRGGRGGGAAGRAHPRQRLLVHARGGRGGRRVRVRRGDGADRLDPGRPRDAAHQAAVPGAGRRLPQADQRQQRRDLRERCARARTRRRVVPLARHADERGHEDLLVLGRHRAHGLPWSCPTAWR